MNQNRFWLQDGSRDKDFIPFQNWPDSLTSKVNRNEKKEISQEKKKLWKFQDVFTETCLGVQFEAICSSLYGMLPGMSLHACTTAQHLSWVTAEVGKPSDNWANLKRQWQSPFSLCPHRECAEASEAWEHPLPPPCPRQGKCSMLGHQLTSPALSPPIVPLGTEARICSQSQEWAVVQ